MRTIHLSDESYVNLKANLAEWQRLDGLIDEIQEAEDDDYSTEIDQQEECAAGVVDILIHALTRPENVEMPED